MAIGNLVVRDDDAPLIFSRSTRRSYPGTVDGGGSGGHAIFDEGVAVPARAGLNFVGNRISVLDSPGTDRSNVTVASNLMAIVQADWSGSTAYVTGDVVAHREAEWVAITGNTGIEPGVASATWEMIKGPALMTTAQRTAFTAASPGDQVYDTDTNGLYVREAGAWRPIGPSRYYGSQFNLALLTTPINDTTMRSLIDYTLAYGGLLTVNGKVDFIVNATTATELRVECYLLRAGSSIGTISGQHARMTVALSGNYSLAFSWLWYDARVGDVVQVNVKRQSGTGTFTCPTSSAAWHGISIIQQTQVP